jgi:hypothetical protein
MILVCYFVILTGAAHCFPPMEPSEAMATMLRAKEQRPWRPDDGTTPLTPYRADAPPPGYTPITSPRP